MKTTSYEIVVSESESGEDLFNTHYIHDLSKAKRVARLLADRFGEDNVLLLESSSIVEHVNTVVEY